MREIAAEAPLKKASKWGIAFAVLIILAGIAAIALPFASGIGITILVGWFLVFSGVFHIADSFHARGVGTFFWRFLIGVVYVIGGLELAFVPLRGLVTLTFVLAIILLVQGVVGIVSYFRHRTMPGAAWVFLNSLITLFLGLIIWWEGASAAVWVIGTLVGVNLIFSGISRLMIWGAVHKSFSAS